MPTKILQLPTIRNSALIAALAANDVAWQTALHVSTNGHHTSQVAKTTNAPAITIQDLIDLIVLSYQPAGTALHYTRYPGASLHANPTAARDAQQTWKNIVTGRRIRQRIQAANQLLAFSRQTATRHAHTLYKARHTFTKTILELIVDGFFPEDITITEPLVEAAVNAWTAIETHTPEITEVRNILWCDHDSFRAQSEPWTQSLREHIITVINHLTGITQPNQPIVFHGFFYYHPQHWALMQLLDALPDHTVYIIKHDDDQNPAFASAARYYSPLLGWPEPQRYTSSETPTPAAHVLLRAIRGQSIDPADPSIRIQQSKTPADFVGHINMARSLIRVDPDSAEIEIPRLFAADELTINRYFERLDISNPNRTTDLSKLPIGIYILRLHECITIDPVTRNASTITITPERVTDIIASNYLIIDGAPTGTYLTHWRRVMRFFADCVSADDWVARATLLQTLHKSIIHRGKPYRNNQSDLERIERVAGNIVRLVPWADLELADAAMLERIIHEIVSLLRVLTREESIHLKQHAMFLQQALSRGMQHLPASEFAAIDQKLRGFSIGVDEPIYVEGLIDIVTMLLSRSIDFDEMGEHVDPNDRFMSLRSLEFLGYERTNHPIHLANLADGIFPTPNQPTWWPFTLEMLDTAHNSRSTSILRMRSETAHLGDLYMLWLGLDGVENNTVTLSWIASVAGETHNRSSLIDLIARARPTAHNTAFLEAVGGIPIGDHPNRSSSLELLPAPQPETIAPNEYAHYSVYPLIHRHAVASAIICQRRFALQWLTGPSVAFQQQHLVDILYGNFIGMIETQPAYTPAQLENLWRYLSEGEKLSLRSHNRVKTKGAEPRWMYTLAGHKDEKNTGAFARAYQAILANTPIRTAPIAPGLFLPLGVNEHAETLCAQCPVNHRCAVATR